MTKSAIESLERGVEAAFPSEEFEARLERARKALAARGLDAALFTGPENIFYLTGQQTPGYYSFQCLLLPARGEPVFLLRQLEVANFLRQTYLPEYEAYGDGSAPATLVVDALKRRGLFSKRVAIEKGGWFLPITFYEALSAVLPKTEDATGIIESMRRAKSPAEIAKIDASYRQAEAGVRAGLAVLRPGISENDIVAEMMHAAIKAGAEYLGMEPLVSSGPRSGIPHATWRRRVLQPGDPVFIEMSGCYDRYHACLMRTAWLGEPPKLARDLESVVMAALDAALAAATPGARCAAPHLAAQRIIDAAGMTERYRKRTGYGLGIAFAPDWGEWQVASLHDSVDLPLEPGMCFHLFPALREYGAFTIGVGETICITETDVRVLGEVPRPITVV